MLANTKFSPEFAVIFILTFGAFSLGMAEFTTIWSLPQMANSLGTTVTQIGPAASFYALGVLVGTPVLALLGSHISRPKLLTFVLVWCCVGNMATSYVSTYEQLLWVRFFCGMPHGVFLGVSGVIFSQMLPANKWGMSIGILMSGIGLALLLIVPLTTYFGEVQDWRFIFRAVALMDLLIIVLLHDLIPELPPYTAKPAWQEIKALSNPLLWWVLAISATAICGRMAVFAYALPLITEVAMMPATQLPLIAICGGIGTLVGFAYGGYLSDKNVHKTLGYALLWCLLVMGLFDVLIVTQSVFLTYVAFFLLGTITVIVPALQVLSMRYAPEDRTFASCLNHAAMNAANAAGPLLAGLLIGAGYHWESLTWMGMLICAFALLIFVLGWWWFKPYRAVSTQP